MFRKRHPPVGSRPGTLVIPEAAPPPRIRVAQYGPEGASFRELGDVEELVPLAGKAPVTWIDVHGLGSEPVLRRIAEIYAIHPLALEDAVNAPQRAKSELYDRNQLLIARVPLRDPSGALTVPQVSFLLGSDYLITFQERPFGLFDPVRQRIRDRIGPIASQGPDYLAYALLDALIDRYYPMVEALATELEDLEEEGFTDPSPDTLERIHQVRRELVLLRRVGWPQRAAVESLLRGESPFVSAGVRLYLRDAYDHIAQIVEVVDSSRDMVVALMDIYLSMLGHRTNEVMKVLTVMASIFIPLTFIAGVYGMNFHSMPELSMPIAYPLVLLLMAAVAVGLLVFFRRRGYIGGARRPRRPRTRDEAQGASK
jgi:magnesium transporter